MRFAHKFINGKCIFCGMQEITAKLLSYDGGGKGYLDNVKVDLVKEDFSEECPKARFYMTRAASLSVGIPVFYFFGPELFFLSMVCSIIYFYLNQNCEDLRWLGLADVKEEYEKLVGILKTGKKAYYLKAVDEVLKPLFSSRDKALRVIPLAVEESPAEIEVKLKAVKEKHDSVQDNDLKFMYQSQIKDLNDSLERLKKINLFLEKFETNKESVVASLKLLRTKLLLAETTGDEKEVMKTLEDLKSLHKIYERVNDGFLLPK